MLTVPAHSLLAPVLAWVIAAARVIPGVCAVFKSSWSPGITFTPSSRQFGIGLALIRISLSSRCFDAILCSSPNLNGHSYIAKPFCEDISKACGRGQYAASLRAAGQLVNVHCQAQSRPAKKFDGGALPWVTFVANDAMRFAPVAGQSQQLTAEPSFIHGFL